MTEFSGDCSAFVIQATVKNDIYYVVDRNFCDFEQLLWSKFFSINNDGCENLFLM